AVASMCSARCRAECSAVGVGLGDTPLVGGSSNEALHQAFIFGGSPGAIRATLSRCSGQVKPEERVPMKAVPRPSRRATSHPVDEVLPAGKLAVYGAQHVLAFYAGAVIVPILLANSIGLSTQQLIHLINADLFTCGIASIIQSVGFWKVGVRLPLLQGVTFTAVSPMIAIGLANGGGTSGLVVIYGAVIVAGLFTLLIAPYFSRL